MGISKKKLFFSLCSLVFLTVSCSEKSSPSSSQEVNSICAGVDCLTSANWKIYLPGREFPNKSRVEINGASVLNECIPKQKYVIDRGADPQRIDINNYYVPKIGELKIDIIDLGADCDSETMFLSNSNVIFDVNNFDGSADLIINL